MNMHRHHHEDGHDNGHDNRMSGSSRGRRYWWLKGLGVLAVMVVAGTALGWVVATLWNWLMPALFGLGVITFWQALGLFLLGRILIGGMRGFGGHRGHRGYGHRRRMHERWERMTAEERESFSRGLKRHCPWGTDRTEAEDPAAGTSANPAHGDLKVG